MRIPRIYLDTPLTFDAQQSLSREQSHYLVTVLRIKVASPLIVFDGHGNCAHATVTRADKKHAVVQIGNRLESDTTSPLRTHLGVCLLRGERMDASIQKSVECGVSHIALLTSERTEAKIDSARIEKRMQHWRKVMISACEQSGQNTLPTLQAPIGFEQWCQHLDCTHKFILDPAGTAGLATGMHGCQPQSTSSISQPDATLSPLPTSVALAIGPEGGFSDREQAIAGDAGFHRWRIGPRVLRAETAPVVALTLLQYHWGDMGGAT